jgi:hypothetical protein
MTHIPTRLLLVAIRNIDGGYQCIFDLEELRHEMGGGSVLHAIYRYAAELTLKRLIAERGFFDDNRIVQDTAFPPEYKPMDNVLGVLVMPEQWDGDDEEKMCHLNDENTHWVTVQEYTPGTLLED